MALLDKKKLMTFAKQKTQMPLAANALAAKRAQAAAPASPPSPPGPPEATRDRRAPPPMEGEEQELHIFEVAERAAAAAENSEDQELEDLVALTEASTGPDDPPAWALEPEIWTEAAEAIGLGNGAEDQYAEPFVVTCYLYKMIGGDIEQPKEEKEVVGKDLDVTRTGGAAKALAARSAARAQVEE